MLTFPGLNTRQEQWQITNRKWTWNIKNVIYKLT